MNQYVIGVDLSTKRLDAALIPASGRGCFAVASQHVAATADGDAARLREVHVAARTILATLRRVADRDGRVAIVAVEQPAAGGNPAVLAQLGPVYGAVCAAVGADELVVGMRVSAWRSALGLRSRPPVDVTEGLGKSAAANARKAWLKQQSVAAAMRLIAEEGHAVPIDTHDAAEAVLIAAAARSVYAAEAAA